MPRSSRRSATGWGSPDGSRALRLHAPFGTSPPLQSKTWPPRRTIVIRKNKITNPPRMNAMAKLRLRRSRALRSSISRSSIASHPRPDLGGAERRDAHQAFQDQSGEQHEEIEDGNREQAPRGGLFGLVAFAQHGACSRFPSSISSCCSPL